MTQGWRARPSPGAPAAPGTPPPRRGDPPPRHVRPRSGSDTDPGTAPASPALSRHRPLPGHRAGGHRGTRGVRQPCPALCPGQGFGVPVPGWRGLPAVPRLSDSPRCRQLPAQPHGRGTRLAATSSACSRAAEQGRTPPRHKQSQGGGSSPSLGFSSHPHRGGLGWAAEGPPCTPGRKPRCCGRRQSSRSAFHLPRGAGRRCRELSQGEGQAGRASGGRARSWWDPGSVPWASALSAPPGPWPGTGKGSQ